MACSRDLVLRVLNERALYKEVGDITRKQKVMVKPSELIRDMITFRLNM